MNGDYYFSTTLTLVSRCIIKCRRSSFSLLSICHVDVITCR